MSEEIGFIITAETGGAEKSVKNFRQELKDSNTEFLKMEKEFGTFSIEAQTAAKKTENLKQEFNDLATGATKLKTAQSGLNDSTEKLNHSTNAGGKSFADARDKVGALIPGFEGATNGAAGFGKSLWALVANPVGLILAAIVGTCIALYAAFKNSFEGGEKLVQVFAGIKAAGQALTDNITNLGEAILKAFRFDFSGAIDQIKGVANEAGAAYNAMSKLTKESQNLEREQATNDLDQAKRAATLAKLREQQSEATDPKVRRAAALELQKAAKEDAITDLDLAKRTADNKIAMLTLEKDGAKKNFVEIAKLQTEQVKGAAESSAELRRIAKALSAADKQDAADAKQAAAERKAAADKIKAEQKAEHQNTVLYINKLKKIEDETALAAIVDAYQKEKKLLQNKIDEEKRINVLSYEDKKITKAQFDNIQRALDIKSNAEILDLEVKHNKEVAIKKEAFEKELNALIAKTKKAGILDLRKEAAEQLDINYKADLEAAVIKYKDNAVQFQAIKNALDAELKAQQNELIAKNDLEDKKKKFALDEQKTKDRLSKGDGTLGGTDFDAKRAALDLEQTLIVDAFKNKVITEIEYNAKVKELADERKAIQDAELNAKLAFTESIGGTLSQLSGLIGKQTAAGKAAAIAGIVVEQAATVGKIIMHTNAANMAAVSASTLTGGMPWVAINTIQGGIAAASSIAAGAKAISALGGGSGGGITAPNLSAAATSPTVSQAPTMNGIQSTLLAQNQQTTAGKEPLKAYVVESEITQTQERQKAITQTANF